MAYHPKILYHFPEEAGEPWLPSNGTEGMEFHAAFCDNCLYERWTHHMEENREEDKCAILSEAFLGDTQPKEWQYDDEGYPHCTKWTQFDWSGDDDDPDSDDPNLPKPIPVGPNQLYLWPLTPNESDFNDSTEKISTGSETRKEREKEPQTAQAE